eukprot:7333938-Pyramimonas_sp.AAC.1
MSFFWAEQYCGGVQRVYNFARKGWVALRTRVAKVGLGINSLASGGGSAGAAASLQLKLTWKQLEQLATRACANSTAPRASN